MRRTLPLYFVLLLLLGSFAGYVWLTYHPASPVLQRAADWPLVGPLARGLQQHLQEKYLPTSTDAAGTSTIPGPPSQSVYVRLAVPPLPPARAAAADTTPMRSPEGLILQQWLPDGSVLYTGPDTTSDAVAILGHAQPLALLGREDDWLHLSYRGQPVWVPTPDTPPLGREPAPVLPVPGLPPNPEHLATARRLLGADGYLGKLGPYPLHTDIDDSELLAMLDHIGHQLPTSYRQRYGVYPHYPAAETAVLFQDPGAYRAYLSTTPDLAHLNPNGHVGDGLLVVAVGEQSPRQVAATVVHEMAHLINRRAIGPALPSWLDEGLAEDLSYGDIDISAVYHADRLAPAPQLRPGTTVRFEGVHAAIQLVKARRAEGRAPSLERLVQLFDFKDLSGEKSLVAYATSGLFVRFLLDSSSLGETASPDSNRAELASAFRDFLDAVAQGEPPTGEALRERLGISWEELEERFDRWLETVG